jgi:hypothetical protein
MWERCERNKARRKQKGVGRVQLQAHLSAPFKQGVCVAERQLRSQKQRLRGWPSKMSSPSLRYRTTPKRASRQGNTMLIAATSPCHRYHRLPSIASLARLDPLLVRGLKSRANSGHHRKRAQSSSSMRPRPCDAAEPRRTSSAQRPISHPV